MRNKFYEFDWRDTRSDYGKGTLIIRAKSPEHAIQIAKDKLTELNRGDLIEKGFVPREVFPPVLYSDVDRR